MRKILFIHSNGERHLNIVRNGLKKPVAEDCIVLWDTMVDGPLPDHFDPNKLQGYVRIEDTLYFDQVKQDVWRTKFELSKGKENQKGLRKSRLKKVREAESISDLKLILEYLIKETLDIDPE